MAAADPPRIPGYARRVGERIDGHELLEPLGRGGNGEVWRADHAEHGQIALKLIRSGKPGSERFRRFAREVDVQRELSNHPGVLPIVDAHIPDEAGGKPWLATPIAAPLPAAVASADVLTIVDHVATAARTLADLHAQGRAHRDIKPSNMYLFEDRLVLGDFGLVDDPRSVPITEERGVLGPRHYVAWEVLDDPEADWRPADVYALGKTLWVLLTRERFPQPGEHQPTVELSRIGSYTPHPLAGKLDDILRAATRLDAGVRISAVELSAALRALRADAPAIEAAAADEASLAQLAAFLRPKQNEAAKREMLSEQLEVILAEVDEVLEPMWQRLYIVVSEPEPQIASSALLGWRTLPDEVGAPEVLALVDRGYIALGPRDLSWSLTGGVALELRADGVLRVLGIHSVLRLEVSGYREVFRASDEVEITSPRAIDVAVRVARETAANIDTSLVAWNEALASDEPQ